MKTDRMRSARTTGRPIVSVIVLGWNGREYLEDCLASVLDQEFDVRSYEVVYVDNGSRDGSAAFVSERFPDVKVVALDRNHGFAEGNNIAVGHTSGEFVVFLNQDTVVHRAWLRELVAGIETAPEIVAGHANVIQPWYPEFAGIQERSDVSVGYSAEVNRFGYMRYRTFENVATPRDTIFLHGVCIVIRRSLVAELGEVFDADFFAYAEDLDLGLRVRALGYRSVVIPRAIVYHKHTLQTSLSWATAAKTVRIIRNRYLAFFKVMSIGEFALMAPLMALGAPMNALEFGLSRPRQLLYGLALVPATAAALIAFACSLPRFAAKRRHVRAAARRDEWCLRAVWSGAGT